MDIEPSTIKSFCTTEPVLLDKECKTNYCDSNQSPNLLLKTSKDIIIKTISDRDANGLLHDDIMPRVAGKRGRNKLKRGEIDDVKQTEADWLSAYNETCKPRNKMNFDYIVLNADDYKTETQRHKMVFQINDNETGNTYLWFKNCTNMLTLDYAEDLERRFAGLDNLLGLGVTFTIRSNPYHSVCYDYNRLMAAFNKMIEKIVNLRWVEVYKTNPNGKKVIDRPATKRARDIQRRKIKNSLQSMGLDADKIQWFRVSEIGENTYMTHIHAIFFGIDYIPIDWLESEWLKLTKDSSLVWVSKRQKKASSYALKYITKQIRTKETPVSLLILWALGSRVWGCSKGLLQKIKESYNKLILNDAKLFGDISRYTIKCLGIYLNGDYSGLYLVTSDPPSNTNPCA